MLLEDAIEELRSLVIDVSFYRYMKHYYEQDFDGKDERNNMINYINRLSDSDLLLYCVLNSEIDINFVKAVIDEHLSTKL